MQIIGTHDYDPESEANRLLQLRDNLKVYYPIEIDLAGLDGNFIKSIRYKRTHPDGSEPVDTIEIANEHADMISFSDDQFHWKGHGEVDQETGMVKVYKMSGFEYKKHTTGQISFYIHTRFLIFVKKGEAVEFNQISFLKPGYYAKFISREATGKTLVEYNQLVAANDYFGENFSRYLESGDIKFVSLQTLDVDTKDETLIELNVVLSERVNPPFEPDFEPISVKVTALKNFYTSGASGDISKTIMGQISVLLGPIVEIGNSHLPNHDQSLQHLGISLPTGAISGAKVAVTSAVKIIPKASKGAIKLSGKAKDALTKGGLAKAPKNIVSVIKSAGGKLKSIVVTPQGAAAVITSGGLVGSTLALVHENNKGGKPIQTVK